MRVNAETLALVKEFEGFKAKAYICPAGVLTVGYGTTNRAGLPGVNITRDTVVTEAKAEAWLLAGLDKFGASIRPMIKAPINENQYGAFLSLAYNIGPGAFAKSSALRKFNAGDIAGAADAILLWNKAGGKVMRGLQRRRSAERALFLKPVAAAPQSDVAPAQGKGWIALIVDAILRMIKGK